MTYEKESDKKNLLFWCSRVDTLFFSTSGSFRDPNILTVTCL